MTRPDQLQPGEHVREMGGGWVILSADFICAMAGLAKPLPDPPPSKSKPATTPRRRK